MNGKTPTVTDATDEDNLVDASIEQLAKQDDGITSSELLEVGMEIIRELDDSAVSDDLVKQYLDEILVLLIAARNGANGKELLHDLIRLFDADLSSGTVYPRLHALEEDDVLVCQERKRTKQYSVNEENAQEYLKETLTELHGLTALFEHVGQYIDTEQS